MDKTKTDIRRHPATREIIALSPELPGDVEGRTCETYGPGGRRGVADYTHVIDRTESMRWIADEEAAFLNEIEAAGIRVELRFRETDGMARARRLTAEARAADR